MEILVVALATMLLLGSIGLIARRRMGNLDRGQRPHIALGGFGSIAANQATHGVRAFRTLSISRLLILVAALDLNESTYVRRLRRLLPVKKLMFPTRQERRLYGLHNSEEYARETTEDWMRVVTRFVDTLVQRLHALKLAEAFIITQIGWQGGHRFAAVRALEMLRAAIPLSTRLGIIVIPDQADRRNKVRENPDFARKLVEDGLLTATIIEDNNSRMVLGQRRDEDNERSLPRGVNAVDDRLIRAVAALVAGPWHFPRQISPADAIKELRQYGPFFGVSFGCVHMPETEETSKQRILRKVRGKRPNWAQATVNLQARLAIQEALNVRPGNSTVDAVPRPWPAGRMLTVTVPLMRGDPRWNPLRSTTMEWLQRDYPSLTVSWTGGLGAPEFGQEHLPFHIQASCFWALDDEELPDPVRQILATPDMRYRVPAPAAVVLPAAEEEWS